MMTRWLLLLPFIATARCSALDDPWQQLAWIAFTVPSNDMLILPIKQCILY
jgi:hypothetical protein